MGDLAVLVGVVVDGSIIVGSLHILHSTLTGTSTRLGYGITVVASALSVWGNIAGSSQVGVTSAVVHAIAPAALIATTHALMEITRHRLAVVASAEAEQREAQERQAAETERRARAAEAAEVRGRERAATMQALPTEQRHAVEGDAQVAAIRAVASMLPADTSTTDILSAVLTAIPDAQPRWVAASGCVTVSNLHNAIARARKRLQEPTEAQEQPEGDRRPLRAVAAL